MHQNNMRLIDWNAWGTAQGNIINTKEEWKSWSESPFLFDGEEKPLNAKVPAIMRRRFSYHTKIALETALTFDDVDLSNVNTIFASRYGELTTSIKSIETITNKEMCSPAAFSHSVHNAAVGLFSIITKNTLPSIAIVAGENSFYHALLEAQMRLHKDPLHQVLVVYSEEKVRSPIDSFNPDNQNYGLALILTNAYESAKEGINFKPSPMSALDFISMICHKAVSNHG